LKWNVTESYSDNPENGKKSRDDQDLKGWFIIDTSVLTYTVDTYPERIYSGVNYTFGHFSSFKFKIFHLQL